jgi:hypothetical protein
MRTITIQQLADALLCTQRNVRDREGHSLPRSIPDREPRAYVLSEVLWAVDARDRALLCRAFEVSVEDLQEQFSRIADPVLVAGYVPDVEDE